MSVEEMRDKIKRLDCWNRTEWKYHHNKRNPTKLSRKSNFKINESYVDELWNTTEVFYITIIEDVEFEDVKRITRKDFESAYTFKNYPHRSVQYLVSRKYKNIIGQIGGGHVLLGSDVGVRAPFKPSSTNPKLKKLLEEYLQK